MKNVRTTPTAAAFRFLVAILSACAFAFVTTPQAHASSKEPLLNAIEIYDGPDGPAYLQLGEFLINGKAEVRLCASGTASLDKSAYNKLEKTTLAAGGVLERGEDGLLRYSLHDAPAVVVVPMQIKFEHNASFSLSELADQATLTGSVITPGGANSGPAAMKKGVRVVFVPAPDQELAEFLLAERRNAIPGWLDYLSKYPASAHTTQAKDALVSLSVQAGRKALQQYAETAPNTLPAADHLKAARRFADQAASLAPQQPELKGLNTAIDKALDAILASATTELNQYRSARKDQKPGIAHLHTAAALTDLVAGVSSTLPSLKSIQAEVAQENDAFQNAIRTAEAAKASGQMDDALKAIEGYRNFATEEPRLAAILTSCFDYHVAQAKQAETAPDWSAAVREYQQALNISSNADLLQALKHAREQQTVSEDRQAADRALEASKAYEQEKDLVHAWEALATLTPARQKLVSEDMERLRPAYIEAAAQLGKTLGQLHIPIRTIADEVAIENACNYLQDAFELSQNASYRDQRDQLVTQMSSYLLDQAKRYLTRPPGSATELGWNYLTRAASWKGQNLDAVRDTMATAATAHAIRSRISILVLIHDQTTQRDSAGFVGRLEAAIHNHLESTSLPIRALHSSDITTVEPDFQLSGDLMQHQLSVVPVNEAIESHYHSGERETPNEAWNAASLAHERALIELQTAQNALQTVQAHGNKKQVEQAQKDVQSAQKNADTTMAALNALPKTNVAQIVRPYTYTRRTTQLDGSIQIQFRITSSSGADSSPATTISKEDKKQSVVLLNVNPEDSDGAKPSGSEPDTSAFLNTLENAAQLDLLNAIRDQVEKLPARIYQNARAFEADNNLDAAAEAYLRFLHLTPVADTAERKHARLFLQEQFNIQSSTSGKAE